MIVYPLDGNHAVIVARDGVYFYSHPFRSAFLHIPSDYPTIAAMERKYTLPRFDEVLDGGEGNDAFYLTAEIIEVGAFLYGDPLPPDVFREGPDARRVIGTLRFPLEHPVCDTFADSVKLPLGTVNVFTDPDAGEFIISFNPDGTGEESLHSFLYYSLTVKERLNRIVEASLRVLEWANPHAYNEELDGVYREEITKRLLKIAPARRVLHYTPVYYKDGELFVECPSAARTVKTDITEEVESFIFML